MKSLNDHIKESLLDTTPEDYKISFPERITSEFTKEFLGKDIEEVSLPEGVETIEQDAFWKFEKLRRITLPSTLRYIGPNAFESCDKLEEVVFHPDTKNFMRIENFSFRFCRNLCKLVLPESLEEIGISPFVGSGIEEIILPENTTLSHYEFVGMPELRRLDLSRYQGNELGQQLCQNCVKLKEVIFPKHLDTILSSVFDGCKSLREVHIETDQDSLYLGGEVFSGCKNLRKVYINAPTTLTYKNFCDCTSLRELDAPIEKILGINNFNNCRLLEEIKAIPDHFVIQNEEAFNKCNIKRIKVLKGKYSILKDTKALCEKLGIEVIDE